MSNKSSFSGDLRGSYLRHLTDKISVVITNLVYYCTDITDVNSLLYKLQLLMNSSRDSLLLKTVLKQFHSIRLIRFYNNNNKMISRDTTIKATWNRVNNNMNRDNKKRNKNKHKELFINEIYSIFKGINTFELNFKQYILCSEDMDTILLLLTEKRQKQYSNL